MAGDSKGGLMGSLAVKGTLAGALLLLGAFHHIYKQTEETARQLSANSTDFALFTHEKGELHCMERELRHPCVNELRNYISEKDNVETRKVALNCVNDVLQWSTDFYELKNMTHLLLDLDVVVHTFDKESRKDDFVLAGIRFAEKLTENEQCIAEFDTKNHMQTRCVPLYSKIAILKYKNAGMQDAAMKIFKRVSAMSFTGKVRSYAAGEAVPWDHWQHTPQIWVPGLRSQPVWPKEQWKDLPIVAVLEDNFATIQEETAKALTSPQENGFEEAYRFLYEKGSWDRVILFHNRTWADECETVFKKTCDVLRNYLPSKPGLPYTSDQNEQAMVIKMKKGTDVELHSGPSNNILNIHIGISGLEGAEMTITNNTYHWEEGKVIPWDGSYDHSINCLKCKEERVIMMVRYMHPDTTPAHFKGITRTHFEEVPIEMQ